MLGQYLLNKEPHTPAFLVSHWEKEAVFLDQPRVPHPSSHTPNQGDLPSLPEQQSNPFPGIFQLAFVSHFSNPVLQHCYQNNLWEKPTGTKAYTLGSFFPKLLLLSLDLMCGWPFLPHPVLQHHISTVGLCPPLATQSVFLPPGHFRRDFLPLGPFFSFF